MGVSEHLLAAFGHRLRAVSFSAFRLCRAAGGESRHTQKKKCYTKFMVDDPTQQTPVVENPTPQETSAPEVVSPVPDSSNLSTPQNLPDIPIVETPIPEPEPVVTAEPPVDVPIPNFRFPFNGDFSVTFAFNAQATTDEMKAKFAQWEISGHHGIDFGLPEGTEVLAVDAGKVLQSSENGDYGNSVTIQHPWGQSLYAHLK